MRTEGSQVTAPLPPFRAIADLVREHAAARPAQAALRHGGRMLDWRSLDALMDRVARALQQGGIAPGEAIAVCGANSIDHAAVFLGALRAGVAVAPLPSGALPAQMATMVADAGARAVGPLPPAPLTLDTAGKGYGLRAVALFALPIVPTLFALPVDTGGSGGGARGLSQ